MNNINNFNETKILQKQDFPKLLLRIPDCPKQLYYRGNISLLENCQHKTLAIVGSRKITQYGKQVLNEFIPILSTHLVIVSGLAFGVDAFSHITTINNNGNTIAVLPCGVDNISLTPKQNLYVAEKILQNNGLLISEFPNNAELHKGSFPRRNRLIAGLCKATLIIEAQIKSGSLVTAYHALEYNREVCAIPGSIFNTMSEGTNHLIKQGALSITNPNEILNLYGIETQKQTDLLQEKEITPENEFEKIILTSLSTEPLKIDTLRESCNIDAKIINTTLSILELKGIITISNGFIFLSHKIKII